MSDFLTSLEQDLVDAARRRAAQQRRRRPLGGFLLAGALALAVGGSAAAGTLYVLRGEVIPAPSERDAGASQTPSPGSSSVLPLRARDPGGGPAWALRVSRSKTGLTCTTVGQDVRGAFGLIGLDGRVRALADGVVDGCGASRSTLVGARVFDARDPRNVRTVVNGVAGDELRGVTVTTATGETQVKPGEGGSFLHALRGYPEASAVAVRLRFAGGRVEEHSLGVGNTTSVGAGEAWRPFPFVEAGHPGVCLSFNSVRPPIAQGPAICASRAENRKPEGYWFAIRRVDRSSPRAWRHGPVTAAWGGVGSGVKRVDVITPTGIVSAKIVPRQRVFVVVFPASVDPDSLAVRVTLRGGRERTRSGNTHLIAPPKGLG